MTSLHHQKGSTTTRIFAVNAATNRLSVANYDADGNLLAWGGETYDWDALGRMQHHNFPDEVYAYTANGERILSLKYRPGQPVRETWTLRDLDGKLLTTYTMEGANQVGDWSWQKDYAYRGDLQVMAWTAEPSPRHRQYVSVDHLGTPRMVTDAVGGVVSVHHYFGFGEELNVTTTDEPKRFTGHERDFHAAGSQDELDYMHARYYKAHIGRFLTVDPVLGSPEQPGSWNRYTYVQNNPTNLVDPDGLVAGPATLLLQSITELCLIRGYCSNETITVTSTPLPVLAGGFGHVVADRVQRFPKEFSLEVAGAFFDFVFEEPDRTICYERNGEVECGEMLVGMLPAPPGGLGPSALKKYRKLATLGNQASVSKGKQGSQMLVRMAKKAGLRVESGGKHMLVFDEGGTLITLIPHSLGPKSTGKDIARKILENAAF